MCKQQPQGNVLYYNKISTRCYRAQRRKPILPEGRASKYRMKGIARYPGEDAVKHRYKAKKMQDMFRKQKIQWWLLIKGL